MLNPVVLIFFLLAGTPVLAKEPPVRKKVRRQAVAVKRPVQAPAPRPVESEAVLRERVEPKLNALLFALRPTVASRVKTAATPLQAGRLGGGSVDAAWRSAEESVRTTFGPGLTADQQEALTLLVAGIAVTSRKNGNPVPLLARVADRLQDRQATLKKSLESVR